MNPLRRLWFGSGQLPDRLRAELIGEGVLLLAEELSGSITRRNWRAAGEYASWEKSPASGAIAITRHRLVVWVARSKHIDLQVTHRLAHMLEVVAERSDRVRFAYEASVFDNSCSGRVEVRLRTEQADRVAALWNAG